MTYCIGMRLDAGLVFLSDSRTNAGVDHVSTFRKMRVYENPGDRVIVVMCAGNLSISQSVLQAISDQVTDKEKNIWSATSMYEVAQLVGEAVRSVHEREGKALDHFHIDFNTSLIVGGQIKNEKCRLFQVYAAGNFIESSNESTYFQIGEAKYGKPIIDRVVNRHTGLDEAAKCGLISMDSTLRSNISVGMPLDLLVYEADVLAVTRFVAIDEHNHYFRMIRQTWGKKLKSVFQEIEDPVWNNVSDQEIHLSFGMQTTSEPMRVPPPNGLARPEAAQDLPRQTLAEQSARQTQQ
jgi:putative proteasome-type protease